MPEWDAACVGEMDLQMLFNVILAANFMDVRSLLDVRVAGLPPTVSAPPASPSPPAPTYQQLACAKVASMIKGKTTEEIRSKFNIASDLTPEEEKSVKEDTKWAEDVRLPHLRARVPNTQRAHTNKKHNPCPWSNSCEAGGSEGRCGWGYTRRISVFFLFRSLRPPALEPLTSKVGSRPPPASLPARALPSSSAAAQLLCVL